MPTSAEPSPQKWQKYSLLADFGLTTTAYLERYIHRYAWKNRAALIHHLRAQVPSFAGRAFAVIKLVPPSLGHLLPNHRVHALTDLDAVESALAVPGNFVEAWYCLTRLGSTAPNVAGRILIDCRTGPGFHTIEQVWNCSPRLLQSFGSGFAYPYVRAERSGWAWRPTVTEVYQPIGAPSTTQMTAELHHALGLMFARRESLERFQAFIQDCGLSVMSLEYKVETGRLHFIDWDTGDDRLVLQRWQVLHSSAP